MAEGRGQNFIILLFSVFTIFLFFEKIPVEYKNTKQEQFKLFSKSINLIKAFYIKQTSSDDLIKLSLKNLLTNLDHYCMFMDKIQTQEADIQASGKFAGIGIEVTKKNNELIIITPICDSPASKAGLKPNDKIIKIDNELTSNMSFVSAIKKMRGTPNTILDLTIIRDNNFLDFRIKRNFVQVKTIKQTAIFDNQTGYIKITKFQHKTHKQLIKQINLLKKYELKTLILDLRNNPGGIFSSAIKTAELFLNKNNIIVITKGKTKSQNIIYKSYTKNKYPELKLVVLINKGSASGAEILAGALKDNKRAVLIGKTTFGKGSIQTDFPLTRTSIIRLTTAKYYSPSGKSIDKKGVLPNIEIENPNNIIEPNDFNLNNEILIKTSAEIKDPQLIKALQLS